MFKIIGIIFIFVSSITYFARPSVCYYCTYRYMLNNASISEYIKLKSGNGLTYKQIFKDITYSDFDILADKKQIKYASDFYNNLGKRNMEDEQKFIQQYIDMFYNISEDYRKKYENNMQTDLVKGISTATIVTILLI